MENKLTDYRITDNKLAEAQERARTKECLSNFYISVNGVLRNTFDLAMQLAFVNNGTATGYKIDAFKGFVLYSYYSGSDTDVQKFAIPHDHVLAGNVIWEWLRGLAKNSSEFNVYAGSEPDIDGSCSKGFIIYNNNLYSDYNAFLSIRPYWGEHHK